MARTFVMGDIHGAFRALKQCLERGDFDYEDDHLICLGDVADGWPETKQCIDELLKIKNLTYLLGNHDFWTLHWMESGAVDEMWLEQGGKATITSYEGIVAEDHFSFLRNALPYYEMNDRLFVHAGIQLDVPVALQNLQTLIWDRSFARTALELYFKEAPRKLTDYEEVYIGHTPVPFSSPIKSGEVWLMDTGAGWSGVLSMMEIFTKEVFTSDPVPSLYPGVEGRKRKL